MLTHLNWICFWIIIYCPCKLTMIHQLFNVQIVYLHCGPDKHLFVTSLKVSSPGSLVELNIWMRCLLQMYVVPTRPISEYINQYKLWRQEDGTFKYGSASYLVWELCYHILWHPEHYCSGQQCSPCSDRIQRLNLSSLVITWSSFWSYPRLLAILLCILPLIVTHRRYK